MIAAHEVRDTETDGHPTVTLASSAGVEATFAPGAGMIGCSLRHRGVELLGQRGGLDAYARTGSTMGIPLLHPWANRLAGDRYTAAGVAVDVGADPHAPLRRDGNGLPIHGLLAASPDWEVTARAADAAGARLQARLDFGARPERLAAFPFPHVVTVTVRLVGAALTVATEIEPTAEVPVPVAFGWHPYLQISGTPRADWQVRFPVGVHAALDDRGIPTGQSARIASIAGRFGDRTLDDLYPVLEHPADFVIAAAGRRVAVRFGAGYPVAQLYAPLDAPFIACEPMTAPTNALVSGEGLRTVAPGATFAAAFTIEAGIDEPAA